MARPRIDPARLTLLLQVNGAMGSHRLREALGISASSLTRLIAALGDSIESIGVARSTRYALRRSVRNFGSEWPIYRIGETGRPEVWGDLRALHAGFRFVPRSSQPAWMGREYSDGVFSGLPFFLQDIRPQGYLGRWIAREAANGLGAPNDIRQWSDDDVLSYFLTRGGDLPGNLVVGDRSLEQALRATGDLGSTAIPEADRGRAYPGLAAAVQRGEIVGSSAGGEQPKFLATVQGNSGTLRSVLVKFSAGDPSPVSQRWIDLLFCEHLAAETLRARGIACAPTQIISSGGRCFLEVERFDRFKVIGRRGVLSLGALEDAFLDLSSSDWAVAATRLEDEGWILPGEARALRWLWCFGNGIANSDMHRANASFWFGDALPYRLAPSYDMLPMLYAPGAQGDLGERRLAPLLPVDSVADVWSEASSAALEFWERVSRETAVSAPFREIALQNRDSLNQISSRFA